MCTDTQQISASHNIHTTHLTLHLFLSHTLAGVCDVIRCSVLRSTEISNRIILVFGHSHQANLSLLVFFSLSLSLYPLLLFVKSFEMIGGALCSDVRSCNITYTQVNGIRVPILHSRDVLLLCVLCAML